MTTQPITWPASGNLNTLWRLAKQCMGGPVQVVHLRSGVDQGNVIYYFRRTRQ